MTHRLLIILALCLAGADAPAPAPSPWGTPLPAWPADASAALQARYDALVQGGSLDASPAGRGGINGTRGSLRVDGVYRLGTPIWAYADGVGIKGAGPETSGLIAPPGTPAILVGVKPRAGWNRGLGHLKSIPAIFAADHRLPLKLDGSVAGYAVTTKSPSSGSPWPDHFLGWSAVPPAIGKGDRWKDAPGLMLDLAFEVPAGSKAGVGICGMGTYTDPDPWILFNQNGNYSFSFRCGDDKVRNVQVPGPVGDPGLHRLSMFVDLEHDDASGSCVILTWLDGKSRPVYRGAGARGADFSAARKLRFAPNQYAPFVVGAFGPALSDWGDAQGYDEKTWRGALDIHGLRIGTAARYGTDADGAQVRLDGGKLDDAYRYLAGAPAEAAGLVCHLDTSTPPTADYPGRYAYMKTGNWYGAWRAMGLFYFSQFEVAQSAVANQTFAGLRLQGGGEAVALGPTLSTQFRDLECLGGWRGIGALNCTSGVYPIEVLDCSLAGHDCGYYGYSQIVRGRNYRLYGYTGHAGLRFVGCDVAWDGLMFGPMDNTDAFIYIHGGNNYAAAYTFKGVWTDQEGGPGPRRAAVYCERSTNGLTQLHLEDFSPTQLANSGAGPAVWLADRYGDRAKGVGRFSLLRPQLMGGGTIVRAEGHWEGTIQGLPSDFAGTPAASGDPANPDGHKIRIAP